MKPVMLRNVALGEGKPKICVPIVGTTSDAIAEEAKAFHSIPADIAEWRADWYDDVFDTGKVIQTAKRLRETLGDTPILFTFRTSKEGGEKEISSEDYEALIIAAAESGFVDAVDVEAFTGDEIVKKIIAKAHSINVKVVASNHDFYQTPDKDEIIRRLCMMRELGADIPKIAVMPQSKKDVLTLLSATLSMSEQYPDCPIITMSMGKTGLVSRLMSETFGSALTFGAAAKASAPGQPSVHDLSEILTMIHQNL